MVDDLNSRESVRRKALWTLSHLIPGDPKAAAIVDVLDEIEGQERVDLNRNHQSLGIDAVRKAVLIERHSTGISIVREAGIPQPWRERFLQASIGSTRLVDGPYAHDWENFLTQWQAEMKHLDAHRSAR
ncbi:hypothetical protein BTW15_26070 [Pseudomonas syringae pv. tomato]|jgi:hypothetical protein|uniref:HEAT repeat domain-containing protein n=2 Tax=Pseudomonas TaxID=286 RepID=A0AB36KL69_PSEUB|nr:MULTISPECIES: hypothetical protein [Pseudomonas]MEE3923656.1 hypothetical protein [Pseudomonas viridiflava]MBD8269316.1 hypothetical protein [Pseudomonas fluorescens]MBD8730996.1 hypothetical protein [Pseudomonas sp. CFBP 13710]MBI6851013.1 hypothetical protein [Pseudomonas syringae]MBX6508809.1 hypothetical protein [Pseudomonas syringae pv. tomato]